MKKMLCLILCSLMVLSLFAGCGEGGSQETTTPTTEPVAHSLQVGFGRADITPEEMTGDMEMVILPGGMPGTTNLDKWQGMDALLAHALTTGARIAAICAAPMILGKRGYLKGRYAVCFPGFEETLLEAKVEKEARVITDGPFTTGIGMGAALEFACELVACLLGIDKAAEIYHATLGK